MPRRWVWSLLDIVALICLGQATLLAQREAAGSPRLDPVVELSRAESDFARFGTRIYEAGSTIVVALRVPGQSPPPAVSVDGALIRLTPRGGAAREDIPVPSGADPARFSVRLAGDELRVIFAKELSSTPRTAARAGR